MSYLLLRMQIHSRLRKFLYTTLNVNKRLIAFAALAILTMSSCLDGDVIYKSFLSTSDVNRLGGKMFIQA